MEQQPSVLKEIRQHGTKSFPCAIYRTHSMGKGAFEFKSRACKEMADEKISAERISRGI